MYSVLHSSNFVFNRWFVYLTVSHVVEFVAKEVSGVLWGLGCPLQPAGARGISPCTLGLIRIMSTKIKKGDRGR